MHVSNSILSQDALLKISSLKLQIQLVFYSYEVSSARNSSSTYLLSIYIA